MHLLYKFVHRAYKTGVSDFKTTFKIQMKQDFWILSNIDFILSLRKR